MELPAGCLIHAGVAARMNKAGYRHCMQGIFPRRVASFFE
jgi:hypothetical protein